MVESHLDLNRQIISKAVKSADTVFLVCGCEKLSTVLMRDEKDKIIGVLKKQCRDKVVCFKYGSGTFKGRYPAHPAYSETVDWNATHNYFNYFELIESGECQDE